MNRICFLIPYFGRLPILFDLWCYTASKSSLCDFYIFTNESYDSNYSNVKIINFNLDEFKKLVKLKLNIDSEIPTPYKTNDYRPAFGIIFEDIVKNYEFWGHCDLDVILGDIDSYLINIIDKYDKIFSRGHMTIYKNFEENNRRFLSKPQNKEFLYFFDAINIKYNCFFDEAYGMKKLWKKFNYSCFTEDLFDDIDYRNLYFKTHYNDARKIYLYEKGKLFSLTKINGVIQKNEVMYIHLQKRQIELLNTNKELFLVIPNKILDYSNVFLDEFDKYIKTSIIYRLKMSLKYKYNIRRIISDYKMGKMKWKRLI